jgi:hypothetical protein
MKIDWSEWYFQISADWSENITATNSKTGASVFLGNLDKLKCGDDPAKVIKERVKEKISRWYNDEQIREWKGKTIPVEDNLDYIENEAEKRGLI